MRVFVLGAGVSKSYGGPLTNQLLTESMDRVRNRGGYIRIARRIDDVLAYAFPVYNPCQGIYPNIEEVLSMLDVWKEFNSSIQKEPMYSDFAIEEVDRWILRLVTEQLIPLSNNIRKDSPITKFAKRLKKSDVIITFNWDLGIEKALDLVDRDWEYFWDPKSRGPVTLLKVHGSIDWFRTEDLYQIPKREHEPLNPSIGRISVLNWWNYTGIIPRRAKDIRPYIIPPTYMKSFRDEEIREIWRNVNEVLTKAEKIYILGYSLPTADPQARITLRSGIERNEHQQEQPLGIVTISNPDPTVRATFDGLGLKYSFIPSRFETLDFGQLLQ